LFAVLSWLAAVLTVAGVAWACAPPGYGVPGWGTPPRATTPAMAVSPTSGPSGTLVTVTGHGYQPGVPIDVHLSPAPSAGERMLLASATTDEAGHLAATVTIPAVPNGVYTLTAGLVASAPFEVAAAPQPPVSPANPAGEPAPGASSALSVPGVGMPSDAAATPGLLPMRLDVSGDTQPPRVTARPVAGQRLAAVLRRGLALTVGCSEACRIEARVTAGAGTARRMRLRGILARRSTSLTGARRTRMVLRLSFRATTKLRRSRAVTLNVALTVTDPSGNAERVSETVKLKR
jgi:hypothetical protein